MLVRAYAYIAMHGSQGLRNIAEMAVLNANYLLSKIKGTYTLPYDRSCMHEFVLEGYWKDVPDIHALDIATRLMDYDFHPPTNYFPLIVHEALMFEPTETETRETLDHVADVMIALLAQTRTDAAAMHTAPHTAVIGRPDDVKAARTPVLHW